MWNDVQYMLNYQDQEKIWQPFDTFISMCIHIDRPEAPEAAEWFELGARAVQVGNEKVASWRFSLKKLSKLDKHWSVWDEKDQ